MGVWYLNQRVIPDTEVTPELMKRSHLALYGAPGQNAVLDRVQGSLPIRVEDGAVVLSSGERFQGRDVGVRFIYPNPEAPERYVLVHTGVTADAVARTRNLPRSNPPGACAQGSRDHALDRCLPRALPGLRTRRRPCPR